MADTDPTERALLLLSLLQTHRFWPGEELTDRLGVSARTLRRDVDRLRVARLPGRRDARRRRRLPPRRGRAPAAAPARRRRSRRDRGRAAVGRERVDRGHGGHRGARARQARAGAARPAASTRARGARQRRRRCSGATTARSVDADALAVLALACRDREQVRFDYRRRDGDDSSRLVEPHQLVSAGRRWYLVAWDVRRDDWRTFRLDRLERRAPRGRAVRAARAPRWRRGRVRGRVDPVDAAAGVRRCSRSTPRVDDVRASLHWSDAAVRASSQPIGCRVRIEGASDEALVRVVTWLAAVTRSRSSNPRPSPPSSTS